MQANSHIPNLFVIGAPKAGTSAFVSMLNDCPEVFVPSVKEPRFFDASIFHDYEEDYPISSLEQYLTLYEGEVARASKYRVDGSVFNMYSQDAINRILDVSSSAKFIVILRDPLTATKSMFSQRMKHVIPQLRELDEDFDVCWQLSKERIDGRNFPKRCRNRFLFRYDLLFAYEKYLPAIIDTVGSERIHIASYSEFKNSPNEFYAKVRDFLEIDASVKIASEKVNETYHAEIGGFGKKVLTLAFETHKLRERFGLTGGNFPFLRKLITVSKTSPPDYGSNSDQDIRSYFSKTYEYIEQLGIEY